MIRCAVVTLAVLIILEAMIFAIMNKKGWRAWPEIAVHLMGALGGWWCIAHVYALDTGHMLLMLAMIGGYLRTWFYRLGFDRRVRLSASNNET